MSIKRLRAWLGPAAPTQQDTELRQIVRAALEEFEREKHERSNCTAAAVRLEIERDEARRGEEHSDAWVDNLSGDLIRLRKQMASLRDLGKQLTHFIHENTRSNLRNVEDQFGVCMMRVCEKCSGPVDTTFCRWCHPETHAAMKALSR